MVLKRGFTVRRNSKYVHVSCCLIKKPMNEFRNTGFLFYWLGLKMIIIDWQFHLLLLYLISIVLFLPRLKIAFKWLVRAFSGYLSSDQVLLLWDRILAYNSLEILPGWFTGNIFWLIEWNQIHDKCEINLNVSLF